MVLAAPLMTFATKGGFIKREGERDREYGER